MIRFYGPVLQARDPLGLARFYEELLGWPLAGREGPRPGNPPEDGWAILRSPDGAAKLEFQWERDFERPVWPTVAGAQQMMIHLDFGVDHLEDAVARAVGLGAEVAGHQPQDDVRVLLDPEGHPFCLCQET